MREREEGLGKRLIFTQNTFATRTTTSSYISSTFFMSNELIFWIRSWLNQSALPLW